MSQGLLQIGLLVALFLYALNAVLIWRLPGRDTGEFPIAFPFIPTLLSVYCIWHLSTSSEVRAIGLLSAVGLEVVIVLIVPRTIGYWFNGRTSLHRAVLLGSRRRVEDALSRGVPINARDKLGWSVADIAALKGRTDILELLMDRGADVISIPAAWGVGHSRVLGIAVVAGYLDTVRFLVGRGVPINEATNSGSQPLRSAVHMGRRDIAELLLEHGAAVGPTELGGITPLHIAANKGYADLARLLLEHGGDPHAQGPLGRTPLDEARLMGHKKVVRLLSEHIQAGEER